MDVSVAYRVVVKQIVELGTGGSEQLAAASIERGYDGSTLRTVWKNTSIALTGTLDDAVVPGTPPALEQALREALDDVLRSLARMGWRVVEQTTREERRGERTVWRAVTYLLSQTEQD